MPRHARRKSKTDIYHIIMRGINRQNIFEDDEDNSRFISTLEKYKEISGYQIYAYCLMSNHFHLLLKIGKEDLGIVVKRIAGSYSYWYNLKYHRDGHLFQDRFKSEAIENDAYLMTAIRYIHQNPVKANLCINVSDYVYSSYNEYLSDKPRLIDTSLILGITDKTSFEKYTSENDKNDCMDVPDKTYKLNDTDAMKTLFTVSNCKNATEFQMLDIAQRDNFIRKLKHEGLSIRQISRLTGISFGIVRKS